MNLMLIFEGIIIVLITLIYFALTNIKNEIDYLNNEIQNLDNYLRYIKHNTDDIIDMMNKPGKDGNPLKIKVAPATHEGNVFNGLDEIIDSVIVENEDGSGSVKIRLD